MKSLSERINWYKQPETRKWKRLWHCVELSLISLSALVVLVVVYMYGNGTKLQPLLMLFTGMVALSSACLLPSFYSLSTFKRWHIQLITLGLGSGAGISAVAAFVVLELQYVSS
ncbi:hypothetical protein [Maricurvus nonylphenolicus]|uniref:hypothetical protein n=1 Tax=Maricurvus nonylphenolicus TaxID=1008307 RepID=UPI0036F44ADE